MYSNTRFLHSFPTRRSSDLVPLGRVDTHLEERPGTQFCISLRAGQSVGLHDQGRRAGRSEEHTSELQSRGHLVCRLLLEKKFGEPSSCALIKSPAAGMNVSR